MTRGWLIPFVLLTAVPLAQAVGPDELLPPEEAFAVSGEAVGEGVARFTFDIADGYYLYRSKVRFSAQEAELGEPDLPAGKVKHDEFFGDVETYRGQVAMDLPVRPTGDGEQTVVTVTSQGCADVGVCYPPHSQAVTLASAALGGVADEGEVAGGQGAPEEAPTEKAEGEPSSALSALSNLGQSLGMAEEEEEFLDPDKAFAFRAEVRDGNTLAAVWDIADGYYLYRERMKFTLEGAEGIALGEPVFPEGEVKEDEFFGRVETYHHGAEVLLPLSRAATDAAEVTLQVGYQGCAEAGLCYPPQTKREPLLLPAVAEAAAEPAPAQAGSGAAPVQSETDRITAILAGGDVWTAVLLFFLAGVGLALTPCVFPMIPILSSIIVGQAEGLTTRRAFVLSLVYVLPMAFTFAVAGVVAGLAGSNLQAALQNPWVLGAFAALFVALAVSMFGFYELQLPSSWQSKLTELSNRQQGGTLIGVAIMGLLSALIVGPCVTPPLAAAVTFIAKTGDPALGGLALFALGLGMGVPLLVVGTLGGKYLPRAGAWMDAVKAVFGVILLGLAIWFLERVLPGAVALFLWGVLFLVSAVYLGVLEPLGEAASGWRRLWKGLGLVFGVYGALLLYGAATGGEDPLQPLRHVAFAAQEGGGQSAAAGGHVTFQPIKTNEDLDARLAAAGAAGQPAMLDFYADWCTSCKEMERYTFSDPGVQAELERGLLLQADVTANDAQDKALLDRFGIFGPPAILFFGPDGEERRGYRVVGYKPADEFHRHVAEAFQ
jgi:thiol:disulfide interchange protein DsbD